MAQRKRHFPACDWSDCAACEDGGCIALTDTDFAGRPCPFYKSWAQIELEDERTRERLRRIFGDSPPITFRRIRRENTRGDKSHGN